MSRKRTLSGKKKLALLVGAAAMVGGTAIVMTGTSQASVACDGLATALSNNEKFIAGQQASPDAQSEARIANRQAVIEQIKRQQAAAGCEVGQGSAQGGAGDAQAGGQAPGAGNGQGAGQGNGQGQGNGKGQGQANGNQGAGNGQGGAGQGEGAGEATAQPPAGQGGQQGGQEAGQQGGGAAGEVVCAGSTVTLSGEGGAPAASSNQFPVGTKLKVTNLDNNKSTTVEVTSVSGSCALLNNAAFEQVREPGKFLIRKARIERVG
ncbi:hypothetical protein E2C00_08705 [Streptomyces sp. WAC05374]|uniref:hypothetical protein n=1 Tax=Streptomyces sp. WAC05374 TaxID=2487420 RepID=UPI000F88CE32|nr:hypothetical protein [Streptomyces sp. WAC05374]RST10448.1 hypothetical protein EF905_27305 [Streptomyces sp. WAC05374]TDF47622.1 hypothetical protein E2C02_29835 [Streptomyces sp. WAC05374]TDF48630.1 hypothetical protein E2B92_07155 [Streptomyces sp. WAC05374]TDF59120.1 hypothetical protein E2C00_08705 [Streptomyces sp. WAC05374]